MSNFRADVKALIRTTDPKATSGILARAALHAFQESDFQKKQGDRFFAQSRKAVKDEQFIIDHTDVTPPLTHIINNEPNRSVEVPLLPPDLVDMPARPRRPDSEPEPERSQRVPRPTTRSVNRQFQRMMREEQQVDSINQTFPRVM